MKIELLLFFTLFLCSVSAVGGDRKNEAFTPEEDPLDKLAFDGLMEYISRQNQELFFDKVVKCTSQVVSGKIYFLNLLFKTHSGNLVEFFAKIYVVAWEKRVEVQEFKRVEGVPQNLQSGERGGTNSFDWYEITNDESFENNKREVAELIQKSLVEKNMSSDFLVLKAGTQVVAGINYNLVIVVQDRQYEIVVYSKPWENKMEIIKFSPVKDQEHLFKTQKLEQRDNFENMRGDVGTEANIDFAKEPAEIQQIVLKALKEQTEFQNSRFQIMKAQKQVVSGIKYILEITSGDQTYKLNAFVQIWRNSVVITDIQKLN